MPSFVRMTAVAVGLVLMPLVSAAAGNEGAELLFKARHLDLVDKGGEVTYHFERTGSDERLVGKNYTDDIRLGVEKVDDKGGRDVVLKIFTGEHARDPQNYPELSINPLFIWYLDRAVATFSSLAGGNHMYLKRKISDALGAADFEATKVDYNGTEVDALKTTIAPFADDPSGFKMQGFKNSSFTIVVSNQVPGYFVDLQSNFVSSQAAGPELKEHIKVVGMGEAK